MKKLVAKLETKLNEKGLNLNITGVDLMQAFGVTLEDMASLCEAVKEELYDNYWIECSTKYISKIKRLAKFDEGVYWYKNASDEKVQKKAGIYEFKIVATDQAGNKIEKNVRLIVKKGYSYEESKSKDLTVSYVDTDYKDWDNEWMVKLNKGVHEEHLDHVDEYEDLMDLASDDMSVYLPIEKNMYRIEEQEIIYIYNKYDYVIGFAMRVKLSNGEYIYLSK